MLTTAYDKNDKRNNYSLFARRSYSYSASFIWNSLPIDILYCNSEPTFKKHLKTFLFNSCFYAA